MPNGPLIPGLTEFDGPKRGVPRFVWWGLSAVGVLIVLLVAAGLFAGSGPLRVLGVTTQAMQPVAYRPTTNDRVIQIALSVPPGGVCPGDDVQVHALEGHGAVTVSAQRTTSRTSACTAQAVSSDHLWVDVELQAPLAMRGVVRELDRAALARELPSS